ncbi:hypothetical protein KUTeg_007911 [Tegillarca granosa]|uniref:G-protein coupled receptors family 1 profile domain-containing protein n=1 Tax=Tegillarca granosa TaxID=220873 RepID=A0ABQ9FHW1_TEGGR|nr:hypothetical protein KUTeg_007911 [Tegillarca granosa]
MAQANDSFQDFIDDYGIIFLNNKEPHQSVIFFGNRTDIAMEITDNYVRQVLGNKSQPLPVAVAFTVAYITVFLTGIFGSVSICMVLHRNRYMRTNLNILLLNLAVVNMISLVIVSIAKFPY